MLWSLLTTRQSLKAGHPETNWPTFAAKLDEQSRNNSLDEALLYFTYSLRLFASSITISTLRHTLPIMSATDSEPTATNNSTNDGTRTILAALKLMNHKGWLVQRLADCYDGLQAQFDDMKTQVDTQLSDFHNNVDDLRGIIIEEPPTLSDLMAALPVAVKCFFLFSLLFSVTSCCWDRLINAS